MSTNGILSPIIAQDTAVGRTVSSSWGTASDGVNAWSEAAGAATLAVGSNEATITNTGALTVMYLGSKTALNCEALVRLANTQNTDMLGVALRANVGATQYYYARLKSQNLGIYKFNSGGTQIVATTVTTTAGSFYYVRFRAVGPNLYLKYWLASGSEPSTWTLTTTDTSYSSPGQFGVLTQPNATSNIISFDSMSFSTVLSQDIVSNRHRTLGRIQ